MRQNFNLLCAILNQNMFVPFCVLFRCILAVVRKTKLKEKSEKRLKMPKAFLHTAATEIGAEKQEIILSCHIFLPFVLY